MQHIVCILTTTCRKIM